MADITMCAGEQLLPVGPKGEEISVVCFRRDNCYRYTAKPNEYRQSYFMTIPVNVMYDDRTGEQTQQCDELSINFGSF